MSSHFDIDAALASNAWPFQEAQKLVDKFKDNPPEKGFVLFETGYGPSGLPHIGTFAEVFRTTLVRRAFERLCDIPTKLYAISDDMDGLRKVPDNLPNQEMIAQNMGKPLTSIPDPFGTHDSFGAHMNNRLREFLDSYGFDYDYKSSTECYQTGVFDEALLAILAQYDKVMDVMLPTLGQERQTTYSPFLPICKKTGKVLQVPIISRDAEKGTIIYKDEDGDEVETLVTGGNCKLQWKPDWGMRWAALGVDYEMHGKDLTPSAVLSAQICSIIGKTPPTLYVYEMFLDDQGKKISKSVGNGISIEEWLHYATPESLSNFLFKAPRKAKRLFFDVIPKNVDEYYTHLKKMPEQEGNNLYNNPAWHIHNGEAPSADLPVSFSLLLNLASVCNPEDSSVLWGFISRYAPDATPENAPEFNRLVRRAINYYNDFIKPHKKFRAPTDAERTAMEDLAEQLKGCGDDTSAEDLQNLVYAVGNIHGFENLREWFKALYETLLGQEQGPRMGSFIALYGVNETITLIDKALAGEDLAA